MKPTKQVIKNWAGKIIAYIYTDAQGNKIVKNFYGRILGRYDKRLNVTKDFYGRLLARGDQSLLLIKTDN